MLSRVAFCEAMLRLEMLTVDITPEEKLQGRVLAERWVALLRTHLALFPKASEGHTDYSQKVELPLR